MASVPTPWQKFPDLPQISRTSLMGTWHIQLTTFPMWLTGTKLRPSLNYGAIPDDERISDTVTYVTRAGKQKQIQGYDTQNPERSAHFTWRGKGLLALIRSDWIVYHLDSQAGVAGIYFTRTPFTPEGVDIVTRDAEPPNALIESARSVTAAISNLAPLFSNLRPVFK